MILSRFTAKRLHGYLDFDVRFNDRLSFLTGINGSGKTTILNCVQALVSPDLSRLQSTLFNELRLDFVKDDNGRAFIEAIQSDAMVRLRSSETESVFEYPKYAPDPALPSFRQAEAEVEHFRDLLSTSTSHPLMAFIGGLPTPMFLGLDRRARLGSDERRPGTVYRPRSTPARRPARSILGTSINEAEDLAVDAYRDAQLLSARVGEELQRQLILDLLTPARDDLGEIAPPTEAEIKTLARIREDLDLFPVIFHLPPAEVTKRVKPFLEGLEAVVAKIPRNANPQEYFKVKGKPPAYFGSLVAWNASKSQLKKIAVISETVSSYNERREVLLRPFEKYRRLVNDFLKDSGKKISIGLDRRSITIEIDGRDGDESLSSLSSGEAQIFVILTNLAFGPLAQRANVFIIDEPELSLHLRWQEMFVDSVLSANANTQFIMATHSPSIILERTNDCIDVVGETKRSRRG